MSESFRESGQRHTERGARPMLVYDGKCGFCRIWINYWRRITGDSIEYAPSQEAASRFPQIPSEAYGQSVQLVRSNASVVSGARAVFETLGWESLYGWIAAPSEIAYRWIARHREFAYQVTRFTFGTDIEPTGFQAVQWLFLRLLGLVYAAAFASLAPQVAGLIGAAGILPAGQLLSTIAQRTGASRFWLIPSIFWAGADDRTLTGMAWCGFVLGMALFLTGFLRRRFERLLLVILFVLYLSYSAIGQEFLSFQWDSLLLEAGFLAIFLGRNRITPWMFRWLVFRLYVLSGAVKLLSGDPAWRNLTALSYHYHTQPLPTVLAWYADKLPPAVQHASTWMVLAIELVMPFLIFMPRRIRLVGAAWMIGLQVLILATGNYAFFNFLTIGLLLFVLDDQLLRRVTPGPFDQEAPEAGRRERRIAAAVAAVVLLLGIGHFWLTFLGTAPPPFSWALRYAGPYQIVNSYGLFAVMTTQRLEIAVEGSDDGNNWKSYGFRYKPDDPQQAPRWVAPFQPRLDWQMWFAALGNYQSNPWFVGFALRLLQGSPPVSQLLASDPFPQHPPRYIRAVVYEYEFTDSATRRRTGAWWIREFKGQYLPPVGLRGSASN